MRDAVRFYGDFGYGVIYGGEDGCFSSVCAKGVKDPILNLEQGQSRYPMGRMIFYVADVDGFWAYLRGRGFHPESPRDASWGERLLRQQALDLGNYGRLSLRMSGF
jgi:hypothetical protein